MTPAMKAEWEAWRELCQYLETRGILINDDRKLRDLIREWGSKFYFMLIEKEQS